MPFPNLEGKHAGRPYVTARRLLDYHDSLGHPTVAVPRAVVLTWQGRLERLVRERRQHQEMHGAAIGSSALLRLTPELGLARLPIGAPAAAIAVEELSARGAELFIGVGTVGAIDERLSAGDLVVCSAALRDEGTSHHYAPPGPFAVPNRGLADRLRAALPGAVYGPSWTTDAPYRETAEEVAKYRAEGIVTVEMEASCLFTVASAVGATAAAAFTVSDVLHGEQWAPHFGSADILQGLWTLFEAAESCLTGLTAAGAMSRWPTSLPSSCRSCTWTTPAKSGASTSSWACAPPPRAPSTRSSSRSGMTPWSMEVLEEQSG